MSAQVESSMLIDDRVESSAFDYFCSMRSHSVPIMEQHLWRLKLCGRRSFVPAVADDADERVAEGTDARR